MILFKRSDKIRKDYLQRKLRNMRPTMKHVRENPQYWYGYTDAIDKMIIMIHKSKT